jgi:hypothetical protein
VLLVRLLTRVYRVLLTAAYPPAHRDRVGDDMVECFEDVVGNALRNDGAVAAVGAALGRSLRSRGARSALGGHTGTGRGEDPWRCCCRTYASRSGD